MAELNLSIEENSDLDLTLGEEATELPLSLGEVYVQYEKNYKHLSNLPTLNGRVIIDDISEEDPTVPDWAKTAKKPSYNAAEVNAVDQDNELSLTYLSEVFNAYLGG